MSRLTKFNQLVFGINALANQIAEFGSLAASTPTTYSGATATPGLVQGETTIFQDGWFAAVLGQNSPAIEDMNALCYLFAYQIAYIFQSGVPEFDTSGTGQVYYTNSLVQSGGVMYSSLTNNNTSVPAVTANWFTPLQAGMLTPNTSTYSVSPHVTLPTNQTLLWPNLTIGTGQNMTVPSAGYLIGVTSMTVTGTAVLTVSGTGIVRVL